MMFETPRLILREFTEADVAAYFEMGNDPRVTRFTGDPAYQNLEQALESLRARPLADYRKHGYGRWAVVLKSSGDVIGLCGLKFLDELQAVDLGYRLLPPYWGQGLATEAARPTLRYGFETLRLDEILGLVDPNNVPSVRILQKLGMTFVGKIDTRHGPADKYIMTGEQFRALPLQ